MANIGKTRLASLHQLLLQLQERAGDRSLLTLQRELADMMGLPQPVISAGMVELRRRRLVVRAPEGGYRVFKEPLPKMADHISARLLEELKELRKEVHELRNTSAQPIPPASSALPPKPLAQSTQSHDSPVPIAPAERVIHDDLLGFEIPQPKGDLYVWHERDDSYPYDVFLPGMFAVDQRGMVFVQISEQWYPMPRQFTPQSDVDMYYHDNNPQPGVRSWNNVVRALEHAVKTARNHGMKGVSWQTFLTFVNIHA